MPHATFVLSTGRCGTQWVAQALGRVLGGQARVEHEPLHNDYAPRPMLAAGDPVSLGGRGARVLQHAEEITRTLETQGYVEAGHPCWSSVPWLIRRFTSRVRVIHLVRHPVPTACSWVSHGAFVPPLLPHLPAKELISPTDPGVTFPEYRSAWCELSPFEKALVYWAEVNAFALRLERAADVPWLRVRYEDLFGDAGETLAELVAFAGGAVENVSEADRAMCVDRHRFALSEWPDMARLSRHPAVANVAMQLGYRLEEYAADRISARFMLPPESRV